jgi:hypothetical protein
MSFTFSSAEAPSRSRSGQQRHQAVHVQVSRGTTPFTFRSAEAPRRSRSGQQRHHAVHVQVSRGTTPFTFRSAEARCRSRSGQQRHDAIHVQVSRGTTPFRRAKAPRLGECDEQGPGTHTCIVISRHAQQAPPPLLTFHMFCATPSSPAACVNRQLSPR